jgi:hypothetical protein
MRYSRRDGYPMRIRKPAQLPLKSLIFRPTGKLAGKYSVGFSIEGSGAGGQVTYTWCGSRRQIQLRSSLSNYMTNLTLPRNIGADDVFVLTVAAPVTLILSLTFWKNCAATEDIAVEEVDGETEIETSCANPTTDRDRKFEEPLVLGNVKVAARRRTPVGRIESLRELPDGAVLHLHFHRLPDDTSGDIMLTASIGAMRRLCVIAAGQPGNSVSFWLQPEAAGESWPMNFYSTQPFTWSGAAQRGYDSVFLPAFSFVE